MPQTLSPLFTIISYSFRLFVDRKNFGIYLLMGGVPMLIVLTGWIFGTQLVSSIMQLKSPIATDAMITAFFITGTGLVILGIMLWCWFDVTMFSIHTSVIYNQPKSLSEHFGYGWQMAGHYFVVILIRFLYILAGLVFLIIPGLIMAMWYSFSPVIAAVEDPSTDAIGVSKAIVGKFFWQLLLRLFLLGLMFRLPLMGLNSISPYLGIIWGISAPFFGLVGTVIYFDAKRAYQAKVIGIVSDKI